MTPTERDDLFTICIVILFIVMLVLALAYGGPEAPSTANTPYL